MDTTTKRRWAMLGLCALLIAAALVPATQAKADGNANPGVIPSKAMPYGQRYEEWSNAWWQWAFSLPVPAGNPEAHPLFDPTGASCGAGQSGPVWFLAGSFAGRTLVRNCTIPAGKAIFFPILNSERDNVGRPTRTVDDMRASAITRQNDAVDLAAEVDGQTIQDLQNYRISNIDTPDGFGFTLPEENLFHAAAGSCFVPAGGTECVPYTAVNDGYYLMLRPLSAGQHTLHFSGTLGPLPGSHLDITYNLTIER